MGIINRSMVIVLLNKMKITTGSLCVSLLFIYVYESVHIGGLKHDNFHP